MLIPQNLMQIKQIGLVNKASRYLGIRLVKMSVCKKVQEIQSKPLLKRGMASDPQVKCLT
jgi:hypothetical protein